MNTDTLWFCFVLGGATTDAMFVVGKRKEKFLVKRKAGLLVVVDLEKTFGRMSGEVIWWKLRKLRVNEWPLQVIIKLHKHINCSIAQPNSLCRAAVC